MPTVESRHLELSMATKISSKLQEFDMAKIAVKSGPHPEHVYM